MGLIGLIKPISPIHNPPRDFRWRNRIMSLESLIPSMLVLALAEGSSMSATALIASLYVFALAAFLGYQVISRVPPLLHTPLMSAPTSISAISVVGSILTAGGKYSDVSRFLGFIAVTSAMINVVGGFMITDRMLKMFKDRIGGGNDSGGEEEKRCVAAITLLNSAICSPRSFSYTASRG